MEKLEQCDLYELVEIILGEKHLSLSEINYLYYMNIFGSIKKIDVENVTFGMLKSSEYQKFYVMSAKDDE